MFNHQAAPAAREGKIVNDIPAQPLERALDAIYRAESRRVLATLIRLLGDFDLAEEALQDAFTAAMEQWPVEGFPSNPRAWLISTGRFRAIDKLRRRSRQAAALPELTNRVVSAQNEIQEWDPNAIDDDQLRLIFTCCHPALPQDAQLALTLREVCGLTTDEIARAFLSSTPAIAKRIVRAKEKIRIAKIPYEVPTQRDIGARLDTVLGVIYLLFTEGYFATSGNALARPDLSGEAIRLARLLVELMPQSETLGLLALMLLHESRRDARWTSDHDLILFDDQDRSLWNQALIAEGVSLVDRAFASGTVGPYALQAAIAALHAESPSPDTTDWNEIIGLYDVLLRARPSPVIELNRAAAIAMRDGPSSGLAILDAILARGELRAYYPAYATRADFLRRLGRLQESISSYEQALALVRQEPARRFLLKRLHELKTSGPADAPAFS